MLSTSRMHSTSGRPTVPAVGHGLSGWRSASRHPSLGTAEVHVWMASMAEHVAQQDALWGVMSAEERGRAERFVFERDRARYVVAHGLLRTLLARYLDQRPERLRFGAGRYGKPYLLDGCGKEEGGSQLAFNMSHSDDLVMVAVARGRAIGVDVERWVSDIEHEELAGRFFSRSEQADLRSLAPENRVPGFFACWTRKEAYIKATGLGVSHGLDYFDVSLAPGVPARLLADRLSPGSAESWTLQDLAPGPGYSGAVVGANRGWRLERLLLSGAPRC